MVAVPAHLHQGSDAWLEWRRTRGGVYVPDRRRAAIAKATGQETSND